jgi:outer membrane lipoprotein-sorting protein
MRSIRKCEFLRLCSVVTLFLGLCAYASAAQPNATSTESQAKADAILDKFLRVSGELGAMDQIKTRRDRGTLTLPGLGITGEVEVLAKAPNKSRMKMTIAGVGEIIEGYDGETAWVQDPIQGYREKTDLELSSTVRQSDFYMAANYKKHYPKREWLGTATVEGKETDKIRLHPTEGAPETWFIDRTSSLLVRMDSVAHLPQGDIESQVYLENYQKVDGVLEPMRIRIVNPLAPVTMELATSESNIELDDSLFVSPRKRRQEETTIER